MVDPVKYFENLLAKQQAYFAAVEKRVLQEGQHLEKMMVEERIMAEEDGFPMSEEEMEAIMSKHKASSPFAMDVEAARQALMEAKKK